MVQQLLTHTIHEADRSLVPRNHISGLQLLLTSALGKANHSYLYQHLCSK